MSARPETELAVVSLAGGLAGAEVGAESFGATAFSYSLWAMALNNLAGWSSYCVDPPMSGIVTKMNAKFDPKWSSCSWAAQPWASLPTW